MCCTGPTWKREEVPEHKFDFVDTRDYRDNSFWTSLRYIWLYIVVIKSFLVYVSDIFTATTMLSTNRWTNSIYTKCNSSNDCSIIVNFDIGKWVFVGCIIFGFLLAIYEARKARKIILSRDISYAFTNLMANNYYSLRSFDHFCFFCQIANSTKRMDEFAFFIFFTFKGWKRLLLADGPRQCINAIVLFSFAQVNNFSTDWSLYYDGSILTAGLLISMLFTVLVFAGSLIMLVAAAVLYIPLLCHIRGNLKEYCCHKVDKRISELIKRKVRQRVVKQAALARKEAAGDFSHYKNKGNGPLPQPTLPKLSVEDDYESGYQVEQDQWSDFKSPLPDYPPPPIDHPSNPTYPPYPQQHGAYAPNTGYAERQYVPYSSTSLDENTYDAVSEYGSSHHLVMHGGSAYGDSKVSLQSPEQQRVAYAPNAYVEADRRPQRRQSIGVAYEEQDYVAYYQQEEVYDGSQHGRQRSQVGPHGGYAA
ncbi:hypothetical protein DACRYDRAFT_19639 [Dacryopinax primogenitus]|uniref:Vacuole protein n=1 Tax=Dacryopinax primogenitus (strain DJM 731) TaxID=1858805 RepID=M5GH30_DACPD|nr:uncharacterized protein DACRYDRAFT_19639 [Dacryopinax primogenitus]EJU06523.1 hypothetical protein DACRYDRAFT_19639 [Dacryopinax primogenitus]